MIRRQECITMNLDTLDLGILECLALNCRLPHTSIADALHVSPNTITGRIKNLEQQGIIRQYVTLVDLRPLGFHRHHVLLRFQGKGHNLHEQCRILARSPSAAWVVSYAGLYDAQVIFHTHEQLSMAEVLSEILSLCNNALQEYAVFSDQEDLEYTNFLPLFNQRPKIKFKDDGSFGDILSFKSFPARTVLKKISYTSVDLQILRELGKNPRASFTELSHKVGTERQTIKKRIERLIEAGVIMSFGIGLDHQQLGFSAYHALFKLQPGTSASSQVKAFRGVEGVFYAGTTHGAYDLSAYFYTRTPQDLNRHMQLIRDTFGGHVRSTDLLVYDLVHHWRQSTDTVYEVLRKNQDR
jgi:DNA-binding Lrp family transcriptional regulator